MRTRACARRAFQVIEPSRTFALLVVIAVVAGCASSASRVKSEGCDGLTRLPDTGTTSICVQSDLGREDYRRATLDRLRIETRTIASSTSTFVGRPPGTKYPVGPQQKRELAQLTEEAFASSLGDLQLEQTDEEGTGVLLVRGSLLDVYFETLAIQRAAPATCSSGRAGRRWSLS